VKKPTRRTIALAVVAVCVVVAAVAATFINHKSSGESRQRRAVSDYIDAVNKIENAMNVQLTRVSFAYRDLSPTSPRRKRAPAELAAAATTLTKLNRRLASMPAPPEAAKLRSLIVRLVAQEAALTREVRQLAVFTPRFAVVVARLRNSSARFDAAMRRIPQPTRPSTKGTKAQVAAAVRAYQAQQDASAAAQAGAVDAYVGSLRLLLLKLHALHAPAVVAPAYDAEVHSLRDVVTTGAALSTELRSTQRSALTRRVQAFTVAGREAASTAVQRAQIAAIKAFNRRSHAVGTAQTSVQDELGRLTRVLP
jgi:hypothetical protein